MGVVEHSHATVEGYLSVLDEAYDSFSVNQTTVSVSTSRYEREREKAEHETVELYVRVHNEDHETLHVEQNGELQLPSTTTTGEALEQSAIAVVEKQSGVSPRIDGVEEATIIGVKNADADESETVYRLAILFEARRTSESTTEAAVWKERSERFSPMYS